MKRILTFQLTDGTKMRLHCIDSSELHQASDKESLTALTKMVSGQNVRIDMKGADRDGRILAEVAIGDTPVNFRMLESEQAWA